MKTRFLPALGIALVLSGCATKIAQPVSGYLCCNQSGAKGWISSENIRGNTLVPFGQKVRVDVLKRTRYAYGAIGDTSFGFSEDSAKSDAATMQWLRQIVVREDPTPVFDGWPKDVRTAIASARVFVGMTRAQVTMAIGHPAKSQTPRLDQPVWKYWTASEDEIVELHFDANDVLTRISGSPAAVRLIELPQ